MELVSAHSRVALVLVVGDLVVDVAVHGRGDALDVGVVDGEVEIACMGRLVMGGGGGGFGAWLHAESWACAYGLDAGIHASYLRHFISSSFLGEKNYIKDADFVFFALAYRQHGRARACKPLRRSMQDRSLRCIAMGLYSRDCTPCMTRHDRPR